MPLLVASLRKALRVRGVEGLEEGLEAGLAARWVPAMVRTRVRARQRVRVRGMLPRTTMGAERCC